MRPVRSLWEKLGLVRDEHDNDEHYRETDEVIADARQATAESRRLRLLEETESYRKRGEQ